MVGGFLLAGVNVVLSAQLATTGERLQKLVEEAETLRYSTQLAEKQVLRRFSLSEIRIKANELGFTDQPKLLVLPTSAIVAQQLVSE